MQFQIEVTPTMIILTVIMLMVSVSHMVLHVNIIIWTLMCGLYDVSLLITDTIVLALVVIKALPFLLSLVMITSVSPVIQVPTSTGNRHYIQHADPLWDGEGCGPI